MGYPVGRATAAGLRPVRECPLPRGHREPCSQSGRLQFSARPVPEVSPTMTIREPNAVSERVTQAMKRISSLIGSSPIS